MAASQPAPVKSRFSRAGNARFTLPGYSIRHAARVSAKLLCGFGASYVRRSSCCLSVANSRAIIRRTSKIILSATRWIVGFIGTLNPSSAKWSHYFVLPRNWSHLLSQNETRSEILSSCNAFTSPSSCVIAQLWTAANILIGALLCVI